MMCCVVWVFQTRFSALPNNMYIQSCVMTQSSPPFDCITAVASNLNWIGLDWGKIIVLGFGQSSLIDDDRDGSSLN